MTYSGSRGFGLSVTLFVTVLIAVVFVVLSTEGVDASTTDIYGDWTITNGTVTLVNETVDVRGNVTVGEGGVLILENSTLFVNQSVVDTHLLVDTGGYLRSVDSRIRGSAYDSTFIIRNDTLLLRTRVVSFNVNYSEYAILVGDGMVEMRDSVVKVYGSSAMEVRTDVLIVNTWIDRAIDLVYNHPSIDRDLTWEIRDNPRNHRGTTINIYPSNGTVHTVNALIDNMSFDRNTFGLNVSVSRGLNLSVTRCEFLLNTYAMRIRGGDGGTALIENNTIDGQSSSSGNYGIELGVTSRSNLVVRYNLVERVHTAYNVYTDEGPKRDYTLGHALARDCQISVRVYTNYPSGKPSLHVTVHNSSFLRMRYGFYGMNGAGISIYDTEHDRGRGWINEFGLFIRAYTSLEVGSVGWMNGGPIRSGDLDLYGVDGPIAISLGVDRREPILIVGWERTEFSYLSHEVLTPSVTRGGQIFTGDDIDIWGPMPVTILIEDDVSPEVQITYPVQNQYLDADQVDVIGTYSELGSGLAGLSVVMDGSDPIDNISVLGGKWTLPIFGLSEGLHALAVTAVDGVGNSVTTETIYFTIDTQRPIIELDGNPTVVNTSTINITGRTEPFVSVLVNGVGHYIGHDGQIHFAIYLREGPNDLLIWMTDRAGNVNSTTLCIIFDSTPPDLMVTSPWNGTWITTRSVTVVGTTEVDAILMIDGELVPHPSGRFQHDIVLEEGEVTVLIVVTDPMKNSITRRVVLFVDWTPPRILIESPEGSPSFTSLAWNDVFGSIEDENLKTVLVNGEEVVMIAGTFLVRSELEEGRNEIVVTAQDAAGNRNSTTLIIERDIEIPGYSVELSLDGEDLVKRGVTYHSPSHTLRLEVHAIEPVMIELDGITYGPQAEMTIDLVLDEGVNDIVVTVRDRAGNLAEPYEMVVVVDTVPPSLTGVRPLSGTKTKEKGITLNGWTEPGTRLTINGIQYSVSSEGSFVETFDVETGFNEFQITVTDLVGNSNNVTIVVIGEEMDGVFRVSGVQYGLLLMLVVGAMFIFGFKVLRSKQKKDVT
jgi:hypothetical protein